MRRFLTKLALFAIYLFGGMVVLYVILDPFMVVRRYDDYFNTGGIRSCPNDAFRGIRLMDLYADSISYNSFIVGSSRSQFYYVNDWKQHLNSDATCFHFNQSADNLLATVQRVKYLFNRFNRIDNLLLIMDHEFLSDETPEKGLLRITPYQVSGYRNFIAFHWEFFRSFYTIKFWKDVRLKNPGCYRPEYNEHYLYEAEEQIKKDSKHYYESLASFAKLYPRNPKEQIGAPVISNKQKKLLEELASILGRHSETDYRIIVSPLYDQLKLNPKDSMEFVRLFGASHFFDFSGKNDLTEENLNYYENSHYRPSLCAKIMDIVYEKTAIN